MNILLWVPYIADPQGFLSLNILNSVGRQLGTERPFSLVLASNLTDALYFIMSGKEANILIFWIQRHI